MEKNVVPLFLLQNGKKQRCSKLKYKLVLRIEIKYVRL